MTEANTTEFGPETGRGRGWVEYRRSTDEPPSVAVARAIARFEGTAATAATVPLYEHVDPDALDALFGERPDGTPRESGEIRFTTDSATVVVRPQTVRVFDRVTR